MVLTSLTSVFLPGFKLYYYLSITNYIYLYFLIGTFSIIVFFLKKLIKFYFKMFLSMSGKMIDTMTNLTTQQNFKELSL